MKHALLAALYLVLSSLLSTEAAAQSWLLNTDNTVLRVAISDAIVSIDEGKVRASIPARALLNAIANTLNAGRIPLYNECGDRASGTWSVGTPDTSALMFAAILEIWRCVGIDIPSFKGLSVRTEKHQVKTKLLQVDAQAIFRPTFSITDGDLKTVFVSTSVVVNGPVPSFGQELTSTAPRQIIFKSIEFTPGKDLVDPHGLLEKSFDMHTLKELAISPVGDLQFVLP